MSKYVKGQLAELTWKNEGTNADWMYMVAKHIYDDRVHFVREDGEKYMLVDVVKDSDEEKIVSNQPTDSVVTPLIKNGKPVLSKKNIFGKYTFQPKLI